jgi:hypothetical protein
MLQRVPNRAVAIQRRPSLRLPVAALAPVLALSLAPVYAAKVTVDYDKTRDFSGVHTYAWKDGTPADNPLTEQKIHSAVIAAIEKRGLKPAEGTPDVYVVTHTSTSSNTNIDISAFSYGGYYGWGGWGGWGTTSSVNLRDVTTGTLLVDVVAADGQKLIWRGVATKTFSEGKRPSPQQMESLLSQVTGKMFKEFPPPPPKSSSGKSSSPK